MRTKTTVAAILIAATCSLAQRATPPAKPATPANTPDTLDILKDRKDRETPADSPLLGQAFESKTAGIAFKPPAGGKQISRATPDEIVEFVNDDKKWSLKVSRAPLSQPLPLTKWFDNGVEKSGVLELTAANLRHDNPNAEIVRQDVIDLGANKVGMLAFRSSVGGRRLLTQQALIQATEQTYYVLTFVSPAAPKDAPADAVDPKEKEAVDVFSAVLDTVQLLDRSSVKDDQDQRLFRTRYFFVNLSEAKLKKALRPEQYFRLLQNGKDVGYTYVVEEFGPPWGRTPGKSDALAPAPGAPAGVVGVNIGVRSRTVPEKGTQVDAESRFFMSADRRHETFSNILTIGDGLTRRDYSTEVGYSDVEVSRKLNPNAISKTKDPAVDTIEDHNLSVTRTTKQANRPPVTRPLPPWYIPQALAYLLPRLLPTAEPKGYMFATWVSEQGEVMSRYVDIGKQTSVTLGGERVEAVPIRDKIGLEGSVTTHFVSPNGNYLGSVNEDSKVVILPSSEVEIRRIWSNANLTKPEAPAEQPAK